MVASHDATLRQYRLLNLASCRQNQSSGTLWWSATAWSATGSSKPCGPVTPTATWRITVLAEEADAAYDRVGLTGYTEHWDRGRLALPGNDYAGDGQVQLRLGVRVAEIDRAAKAVVTADRERVDYDALVLATGSYAFVPPVPGNDLPSCHVYRTLDDLDAIRADAQRTRDAGHDPVGVVIGGGLLGLEAANALRSFGLHAHVVEMAPRLMAQQLDEAGGALLGRMIAELGISVHVGVGTDTIAPAQRNRPVRRSAENDSVRVTLSDGRAIDAGLVVFAAGVRPRDELARSAELAIADRGGVLTDLSCATIGSQHLCRRRGSRDRGSLLRPGRPRLHQRRSGGGPTAGRRRGIPRSRHVDQAQAARRRRCQLRRRDGCHAGLPGRWWSTTPSTRPTPSWCCPTTPRHCSAAFWWATPLRTASCGRWSAKSCPVTRWR